MPKVSVTSGALNIRRQPSANSDLVGTYAQGEVVEVLAEVEGKYLRSGVNWFLTSRGWIAKQYTQPVYSGPAVTFAPAMHAPGSDWMWQLADVQNLFRSLNMPVKFLSIGFSPDYWHFHKPEFHLVRIYWQHGGSKWTPQEVWNFVRGDVLRFYNQGARKFELFNEPNLRQEGLGVVWQNGAEFGRFLQTFISLMRPECPDAQLYYPGLSPGLPWTSQFAFTDAALPLVRDHLYGLCMHAYSGTVNHVETAVSDITSQVKGFQQRYTLDKPLVVSECSVNRAANGDYKAAVYAKVETALKTIPGIEALVYFISHWEAPPDQATHGESWLGTNLPDAYKRLKNPV